MNRSKKVWLLISAITLVACGGPSRSVPSATPTAYSFAGQTEHLAGIEGIRATIVWTIAPKTLSSSAQSTWIGIFGKADSGTRLSFKIAQIGWKQAGQDPPRAFWEWGTDQSDNHIRYGPEVASGDVLQVELDRSPNGEYAFLANGVAVAKISLAWVPDYVSANAETQNPGDYLAGSSGAPETVSGLAVKVQGTWRPLAGDVYSTSSSYRAKSDSQDNLLIWDSRL